MQLSFRNNLIKTLALVVLCLLQTWAQGQNSQTALPPSIASDPEKAKLAEKALKDKAATDAERAKKTAAIIQELSARPTPKMPDGHPDLSGLWVPPLDVHGYQVIADGKRHDLVFGQFGLDGVIPGAVDDPNAVALSLYPTDEERNQQRLAARRPKYKPQYEAKVEEMIR